MKTKDRVNIMATLDWKNKLSTIVIAVLLALLLLQAAYMLTTGSKQSVVIIPKGLEATVVVGQQTASKEYLMAMGNYATYLFLNFDTFNVISQYDTIASLSTDAVRAEMIRLAEDYRKSGVSSRCFIHKIDVTDQVVTLRGQRTRYILDKPMEEKSFTLNIKYEIRFGTFRIAGLELL